MATSRKNYEATARILKAARTRTVRQMSSATSLLIVDGIIRDMTDMFQADNPRFDRARFLAACGHNTDGGTP